MARKKIVERPSRRMVWLLVSSGPVDCKRRLLASTALISAVTAFVTVSPAFANPTGGQVVGGAATIVQTNSSRVDIDQSTNKAIINWQTFGINQGEQVNFNQPSQSAIALNRVTGGNASTIAGQLTANGQVWLVNPNGVLFTKTAQVDVGGLVATTSDIGNRNFMAGNYKFNRPGNPNAAVENQGNITVAQAGLAALVAPTVRNSGVIEAKLGKVALASGNKYTLDLYGDNLVKFAVDDRTAGSLGGARVDNSGTIDADGGIVLLTASQAAGVVDDAINVGGIIDARSTGQGTGTIVLNGNGGNTRVGGTLDASGYGAGQTGGTVDVLGGNVHLASTATIDVSGDAGGGTVHVGGNFHGAGPQPNAIHTTVAKGATIKANAISSGNGGNVAVWSNKSTSFDGTIEARGATGGHGGMVETSGASLGVGADAIVDTSAAGGTVGLWLLDPQNIDVVSGAPTGDQIAAGTIVTNLNTSDVTLQAGNDITVDGAIDSSGNANTHNLTMDAGESIDVNANIKLNGSFSATANDSADVNGTTMLASDRGTAGGSFIAKAGTSIDVSTAPGQSVSVMIGPWTANPSTGGDYSPGIVELAGVNAGGTGALTVSGSATFIGQTTDGLTVGGASSFTAAPTADVMLANTNNTLGGTVSLNGADVTLANSGATNLGASIVQGNLIVTAQTGDVTQSGAMTVAGTASINAGGNIALTDANNQFSDTVGLTAPGNILFTNDAGITNLGNVTAGGTLTVDSKGGDIVQTAATTVQAGGTSSFTTEAPGSNITLGNSGNALAGAISLATAGSVSLANGLATHLGASTIGGNLSISSVGNITQNGALVVFGNINTAATGAGASIDLGNAGNQFYDEIDLQASSNINLANSGPNTDLRNIKAGGAFSVDSSAGNIVQSSGGSVQTGWSASFTTDGPGSSIYLLNGNSVAGPVSLTTHGNASFANSGATNLGQSSVDGNLSVTTGNGDITESGPMTVLGTASFTAQGANANIALTDPGNQFSDTVNMTAPGSIAFTNNAGITNLGNVNAGGSLNVDSQAGNIVQTAGTTLQAGGASSFSSDNPGSSVILGNPGNMLNGPVTLFASKDIVLHNAVATSLAGVIAGGSLNIEVGSGNLTQTGSIRAGWTSTFTTDSANAQILLNDPSNALAAPVSVNTNGLGGDVSLTNNADTTIANSSVGGALTIDAQGHALDLFSNLSVTQANLSGSNVTNVDPSSNTSYMLAVGGVPAGTLTGTGDLENVTVNGGGGAGAAQDFHLSGQFTINGANGTSYVAPLPPVAGSTDPAPAPLNVSFQPNTGSNNSSNPTGDNGSIQGMASMVALANQAGQGGNGTAMGSDTGLGAGGSDAIFNPLFEQISQLDASNDTPTVVQPEQAAATPAPDQASDKCADDSKNLSVCVALPGTSLTQ